MSISELNGGSVGSWGQFVRLKEAAKERGFNANAKGSSAPTSNAAGTNGTSKFSEILSSTSGANVYLDPNVKMLQNTLAAVRAKDLPAKGGLFDSYA